MLFRSYIPPVPKDMSAPWERFKAGSMLYRVLANKILESKVYNDIVKVANDLALAVGGADKTSGGDSAVKYVEWRRKICIEESWPLTLRLIQLFKETVEQNGAHFILVDGEPFYDESVGSVYSNHDLEEFCRRNGINYIAAYKPYSKLKSSTDTSRYFFRDHHLKPEGIKQMSVVIAEHINAILTAQGLLR